MRKPRFCDSLSGGAPGPFSPRVASILPRDRARRDARTAIPPRPVRVGDPASATVLDPRLTVFVLVLGRPVRLDTTRNRRAKPVPEASRRGGNVGGNPPRRSGTPRVTRARRLQAHGPGRGARTSRSRDDLDGRLRAIDRRIVHASRRQPQRPGTPANRPDRPAPPSRQEVPMGLFSSMTLNTLDDLFLVQLQDLYDAEQRLTKALPKMADAANDPGTEVGLHGASARDRAACQATGEGLQHPGHDRPARDLRGDEGPDRRGRRGDQRRRRRPTSATRP